MEKNSKNTFINDFVEKNQLILEKTESISIAIFIIGFLCFFLQIQGAKFILIIGSVLSAISFYLHSYKMIDFTDVVPLNFPGSFSMTVFCFRLYFWALSISMIPMLGLAVKIKMIKFFLILGSVNLIIVLIISLLAKMENKSKIYDSIFYLRLIICLALLGILTNYNGLIKII